MTGFLAGGPFHQNGTKNRREQFFYFGPLPSPYYDSSVFFFFNLTNASNTGFLEVLSTRTIIFSARPHPLAWLVC